MKNTNEEYIQLPPLPKNMEGSAVRLIWEYMKLPKEKQKLVYEDLNLISGKDLDDNNNFPEKYRKVDLKEIADYTEAVNDLIRTLVLEASDIATWVFCKKYIDGWSVEEMIAELPHAIKFIISMDTLFERNIENKETNGYEN